MKFRVLTLISAFFVCGQAVTFPAQNPAIAATPASVHSSYLPLKKCWEYDIDGETRLIVAAENGTVYVGESDGRVRALSVRTGSIVWSTELGGRPTAMAALPRFGIAVITAVAVGKGSSSTLRMLDPDSGLVRFRVPIAAGEDVYLLNSGSRLIVADAGGDINVYDAQTGETVWRLLLPAKLSTRPAVSDGSIVIGTQDKKISLIEIGTGRISSAIPVDRNVTSIYVRQNGMIVSGDERGNVINYRDIAGSVWWKFKSGGRVGAVVETAEGILVGSFDNFIYMLSKYTGDVKWKRRLDGRVVSTPAVFDGYLLASSSTEVNAQVLDLDNGKPVDQLQFGENNFVLNSPLVSGNMFAVFPLVNGLVAFSPSGCQASEKGGITLPPA